MTLVGFAAIFSHPVRDASASPGLLPLQSGQAIRHAFLQVFQTEFWPRIRLAAFQGPGGCGNRVCGKMLALRVGAVGLMQIMPTTFREIVKRNRHIKGSGKEPKWSIAAGIDYNRSIWLLFKEKRPFQDRLDFMFGAYNAGKGNIFRAQRSAKKREV